MLGLGIGHQPGNCQGGYELNKINEQVTYETI